MFYLLILHSEWNPKTKPKANETKLKKWKKTKGGMGKQKEAKIENMEKNDIGRDTIK